MFDSRPCTCMHIHAHHPCTSIPFYVAQPLQAEPLPADAAAEQALQERKPEEARNGEEILGILYICIFPPRVAWVGSSLQISFSLPHDMAAIHKNSERNAFFSSLGHEKWMSRILKLEVHLHI